jgi:apolipoprotein N-acyltransferase
VVLAVLLAGCLWLALTPPRWLAGGRRGRRFGAATAVALVAGFVLVSQLGWRGVALADAGMMSYLLFVVPLLLLAGSAAAAAAGRRARGGGRATRRLRRPRPASG